MNKRTFVKLNNFLLLIVSIMMILTGYGISNYQFIGKVTFGLLDKASAFRLHSSFSIFFVVFLVVHLSLPRLFRKKFD